MREWRSGYRRLTSRRPAEVIVNTRNGSAVPFLDGDDVVEVPALRDGGGLHPLAAGELPRSGSRSGH